MRIASSKKFLIISIFIIFVGVMLHYNIRTINDWIAYILYYMPLFLLLAPSLLFWSKKWSDVRESKPLLLMISGILIGILIIFMIAIIRLTNQGKIPFGTTVYYFLVYGVSLQVLVGIIWFIMQEIDWTKKVLYSLVGMTFVFFMISSIKGFYIYDNNVYGFSGPFMRWIVFWGYMFQDIKYTLVFLFFPVSVYAKYRLLED